MSAIDFVLLIVVLAGVILGFRRGLIEQIASIIAIVAAIIVTRCYGEEATQILLKLVPDMANYDATICSITGHAALFIIAYISVRLLGGLCRTLFHTLKLGTIDRIGGAAFCTLKYALGLSIVLNLWLLISPQSNIANNSKLFGTQICHSVVNFAPWLLNANIDAANNVLSSQAEKK